MEKHVSTLQGLLRQRQCLPTISRCVFSGYLPWVKYRGTLRIQHLSPILKTAWYLTTNLLTSSSADTNYRFKRIRFCGLETKQRPRISTYNKSKTTTEKGIGPNQLSTTYRPICLGIPALVSIYTSISTSIPSHTRTSNPCTIRLSIAINPSIYNSTHGI